MTTRSRAIQSLLVRQHDRRIEDAALLELAGPEAPNLDPPRSGRNGNGMRLTFLEPYGRERPVVETNVDLIQ